jgi:TP901 family phage tail tape measure protein
MTGETGAALDGLKNSLANVSASGMVQGIDDVGKALAELHIRLGLSGDDLEKAVAQFGEFADITGQPVAAAVTDVTKLMAQWKIPADDLELTLDKLTKTTQLTGVSAADLTKNVADSGPIFKAAGFSINEALGLMTGFQKAGIDASSATQGINIALRKFAAEGVTDSKAALKALIEEIASTPDKSRAATLAVENFGRSGITMGQAIRDGALDVGKWTDAIAEAEGTLKKTGDATQSLDDVTKKLGSQVQGLLAESFKSILEIIKPFLALLSDSIKAFESLPAPIKSSVEAIALMAGGLSAARVAMVAFGLSVDAALGPIGWVIGAITLITMGVFAAVNAQKEYNAALEKQSDENAKHAESAQKIVGSITELNRNQKINQDQANELIRIYPELTGVIKANDSTLGDSAIAAAAAADAHTKLTAQLQLEQVIAQKKTVYVDLDEMHRQFNELNASRKAALAQGDSDMAKSYAVELAGVKADYDAKKVVLAQLDAEQKKYQTQVNFGNQQFSAGSKKANAEVVADG